MITLQSLRQALSRQVTRDDVEAWLRQMWERLSGRSCVLRQSADGSLALNMGEDEQRFSGVDALTDALSGQELPEHLGRFALGIEPPSDRVFSFDLVIPNGRDIRARDIVRGHFSSFSPFAEPETFWLIDRKARFAEGRRISVSYTPRAPLQPLMDALSRAGIDASSVRLSSGGPPLFIQTPARRLVTTMRRHRIAWMATILCALLLALPFSLSLRLDRAENAERILLAKMLAQHRELGGSVPDDATIAGLNDASQPGMALQEMLNLAAAALPPNAELREIRFDSSGLMLRVPSPSAEALIAQAKSLGLNAKQISEPRGGQTSILLRPDEGGMR